MKWRKLGRVFCPAQEHPWMASHAANPVADVLDDRSARIYFSTRDTANRSSVAWVDIDARDPLRVRRVAAEPALSPGALGAFDDSGCSIGCIVRDGQHRSLYYMGWNLGVTVPWRNAIGLATSGDGERFERASIAPILDRSAADPYTLSYPWVLRERDGWRMWYGSNLRWGGTKADMDHRIKSARSPDGRVWTPDDRVSIEPAGPAEYAFARPCVLRDPGGYRMWYAFRGAAYRIGYAESADGDAWTRRDEDAGIAPTPGEWDGESVEYPSVFDLAGERYLLYCGDGYGRTGFGIAVLER